jgi:hypothetical protein
MALRRSGCDCGSCRHAVSAPRPASKRYRATHSPWLHVFHRARGRQQSAPFGSANAWRDSADLQCAERHLRSRRSGNPSGAAIFGSQSGRARRRRLEAGRSCNRSLWSMTTDLRLSGREHCSDAAV